MSTTSLSPKKVVPLNLLESDESKNQQTSCPGKLWEFGFATAIVIFTLCLLYAVYDTVPVENRILGVMLALSYCNYIFWACKNVWGSEGRSQEV
jgi:hypothetical protein